MSTKKIGIDIMGVILPKATETGTFEEFMACSALPGAIQSIKKIVNLYKPQNVFIISRCPELAENGILQWLDNQKFFTDINFDRSNVYFCRERVDKALIAERLQLTFFIDDRIDVLDAMKDIVANRILFTGGSSHGDNVIDDDIIILNNWDFVLEYIKINN